MDWIEGRTFKNQDVKLDFSRWRKCDFIDCNVIIEHGEYDLVDCNFNHCRLSLIGHATAILKVCKLFFPIIPIIEGKT